jgi:hypothetical protein
VCAISIVGAERFFEVISRAYERHGLMVTTTNVRFESWTEVICSDRLTRSVHIIESNGESYRLRHARKRASGQSKHEQPEAARRNTLAINRARRSDHATGAALFDRHFPHFFHRRPQK